MKTTYKKICAPNLLMGSNLPLGTSFRGEYGLSHLQWLDLLIIVTTALTCQDILHEVLYSESYTAGVKYRESTVSTKCIQGPSCPIQQTCHVTTMSHPDMLCHYVIIH